MPIYYYEALSHKKRKKRGMIEAYSVEEAKEKLRSYSIIVTNLRLKPFSKKEVSVNKETLVFFTVQLSQLLKAGLPLFESLKTLRIQIEDPQFEQVLLVLIDKIQSGSSFSKALSFFPKVFSSLYCSLVSCGEATGCLETVLDNLGKIFQKNLQFKRKLFSQLLYPILLTVFSIFVVIVLTVFVIPTMESLFEDRNLGALTKGLLCTVAFFRNYGLLLLVVLLLLIIILLKKIKEEKWRIVFERFILRLPVVKKLFISKEIVIFSSMLSILLEHGVDIVSSISLTKKSLRSIQMRNALALAEEEVLSGKSLGEVIERSTAFPPLVKKMITIGEKSGSLITNLKHLDRVYRDISERCAERITTLLSPMILIVLGGIIGMIVLAVYLPLSDFSHLQM